MRRSLLACCFGLTLVAGNALAGGQQVAVEVAPDGQSLLVRTYRCGTPAEIVVTGTAEGLVDGQRRTLDLKLTSTRQPGVFAVARQWPAQGAWVLTFTAQGKAFATALVELQPGAVLRIASQESSYTKLTRNQVLAALERLAR